MPFPPFARKTRLLAFATATLGAVCAHGAGATQPTANVVEYYNASLNHYFITADPAEAAMLDQGVIVPGWTRTGETWSAWANAGDDPTAVPVCRFFGTPGVGPNSHFYTADAAECATVKQNPDWTFEAIAFYIDAAQGGACAAGTTPIYRSFYPGANVSQSNHRFLPDMTMFEHMAPASILEGVVMCSPLSSAQVQADSIRLLEQSTFGPNDALLAHVQSIGTQAFLNEQFAAPSTQYPTIKYVPDGELTYCPTDPDPQCPRDYYSLFPVQSAFFANALTANDQLRQRVAFALSQIVVTSGLDVNMAYAMAMYQQILRDNAFGNYEDILTKVTLSSVMGQYLNMVNNDKPANGINPNENYAREVLQLFSIGVWNLNQDGTQALDATGAPVPSYSQDIVESFAHVFTGWTYPVLAGTPARTHNPKNFLGNMVAVDSNHDNTARTLLNGAVATAGLSAQDELTFAIHNIFTHQNVGPFIGKQLIQKLVTGDPTTQYVSRVAAVFNNNGQGVRGDMKAVVNAVLTDPEARGAVKLDPGYGKLREPELFMSAAARFLNTQSDGVYLGQQSTSLGQSLFNASSVFNYYPPNYVLPDKTNIAPEFAIQNSSTSINRYNFANTLSFGTIAPLATLPGATGTTPNWTALSALAGDPNALLNELDALLMHGTTPAAMRTSIVSAINAIAASDPLTRAKTAFYLVTTSPQYQVER
jgi:hypothetical protein